MEILHSGGVPHHLPAQRRHLHLGLGEQHLVHKGPDGVHPVAQEVPVVQEREAVVGVAAIPAGVTPGRAVAGSPAHAVELDLYGLRLAQPAGEGGNAADGGTEGGVLQKPRYGRNGAEPGRGQTRAGGDDEVLEGFPPVQNKFIGTLREVGDHGAGARGEVPAHLSAQRRHLHLRFGEEHIVDKGPDGVHTVAQEIPVVQQREAVVGVAAIPAGVRAGRAVAGSPAHAVELDLYHFRLAQPAGEGGNAADGDRERGRVGRGVLQPPLHVRRLRRVLPTGRGGAGGLCADGLDHAGHVDDPAARQGRVPVRTGVDQGGQVIDIVGREDRQQGGQGGAQARGLVAGSAANV